MPSASHATPIRRNVSSLRTSITGREEGGMCHQLTSFNMRTFLLISPTCSSFWLSSSSMTASLYWPFRFGVAGRKPPSWLPRAWSLGYAWNPAFAPDPAAGEFRWLLAPSL
nr:hypothetical protein CFP56_13103 [Quercus suber]